MAIGRYISDDARVYAGVPITVDPGDIVDWPDGLPDDGRWEDAGKTTVTRGPDNSAVDQPPDLAPVPESVTDPVVDPQPAPSEPDPIPADAPAAQ